MIREGKVTYAVYLQSQRMDLHSRSMIAILTIVHSIYRPGKLNVMWLLAQIAVTIWCADLHFKCQPKAFSGQSSGTL